MQRVSRLFLSTVVMLVFSVGAWSQDPLSAAKVPLIWRGTFAWGQNKVDQSVAFNFPSFQSVEGEKLLGLGAGSYNQSGTITNVKVRMEINIRTRAIEIWESELAAKSADFQADGSYKGTLGPELRSIDAQWTTQRSGERGHLILKAD